MHTVKPILRSCVDRMKPSKMNTTTFSRSKKWLAFDQTATSLISHCSFRPRKMLTSYWPHVPFRIAVTIATKFVSEFRHIFEQISCFFFFQRSSDRWLGQHQYRYPTQTRWQCAAVCAILRCAGGGQANCLSHSNYDQYVERSCLNNICINSFIPWQVAISKFTARMVWKHSNWPPKQTTRVHFRLNT